MMNRNMDFNFDTLPNRRASESAKWNRYEEDVLPMWVADMDFRSPEPVIEALKARVDHGVFGYPLFPEKNSLFNDRNNQIIGTQRFHQSSHFH